MCIPIWTRYVIYFYKYNGFCKKYKMADRRKVNYFRACVHRNVFSCFDQRNYILKFLNIVWKHPVYIWCPI